MTLQNRVDPFGRLHAHPGRGLMMGNRGGRFHLPGQVLGSRRWASRQWIACVCQFRGRQRKVWGQGYTELFFLDEVTALASGHRPCFECRRADALAFQAWFGVGAMRADAMDLVLHAERLAPPRPVAGDLADWPDATMLAKDGTPCAVQAGSLLEWTFDGYRPASVQRLSGQVILLTPPSVVKVLERGYRPLWHTGHSPATVTQRISTSARDVDAENGCA